MHDVIIIGAGPAGLSAAQTLASARNTPQNPLKVSVLVIDSGTSHLNKAAPHQAPAISLGLDGLSILSKMREDINTLGGVEWAEDKILEISGDNDTGFVLKSTEKEYQAKKVVVATGAFDPKIAGLPETMENPMGNRGPMVMLSHKRGIVKPGLFVAGLLAGESSMFAIAAGSGCHAGIMVYRDFLNSNDIIHDVPGGRS
ncbi:MAG: NAD(P)/FAD-dependent oxidoreductase [Fibrobacter sp.]|nr:NAD(P)/FAD-dependent oxidoreductase [Fibrobacter sp.]